MPKLEKYFSLIFQIYENEKHKSNLLSDPTSHLSNVIGSCKKIERNIPLNISIKHFLGVLIVVFTNDVMSVHRTIKFKFRDAKSSIL